MRLSNRSDSGEAETRCPKAHINLTRSARTVYHNRSHFPHNTSFQWERGQRSETGGGIKSVIRNLWGQKILEFTHRYYEKDPTLNPFISKLTETFMCTSSFSAHSRLRSAALYFFGDLIHHVFQSLMCPSMKYLLCICSLWNVQHLI